MAIPSKNIRAERITGSLDTNGFSISGSLNFTGSLFGTASFATTASVNTNGNPLIGGSITSGQVAFGTASGVIGGDSGLFWDNVNKRLGVGTTTPARNLEIIGGSGAGISLTATAGTGNITVLKDNNFVALRADGTSGFIAYGITTSGSRVLRFVGNGTEVARFFTSGNVLIQNGGTFTDAGFRLDVNGTARFGATTIQAPSALSTDIAFRVRNSADSNNIISVQGNGVLQHISLPSTTVSTTTNVYSFPITLGITFKMMYAVGSGSDIRGGEYICVHNETNVNTIHTFPTEFGDTSGINFTFSISGGNIVVTANVTTGTWAVKLNIQIL